VNLSDLLLSPAATTLWIVALTLWWYLRREEPVTGRWRPGVLRAVALALLVVGAALPSLRRNAPSAHSLAILLDRSASMRLPVGVGGGTRRDSARALVETDRPARLIAFGERAVAGPADSIAGLPSDDRETSLSDALELARSEGADSVILWTDGEFDDRKAAVAMAERLGLGVRERRLARRTARVGLGAIQVPERLAGGDSLEVSVEIVSSGPRSELPDSVGIRVSDGRGGTVAVTAAVPTPGRRGRVSLRFRPRVPATASEWRSLDVTLAGSADPFAAASHERVWVEITRGARGAVLVALEPDWEPKFLLPVLVRSTAGGARGYVRIGEERFVRLGASPRPRSRSEVERDVRGADLLVVQGDPGQLPGWLDARLRSARRILFLPRAAGSVPGTPLHLGDAVAGDWYPDEALPSSPVTGYLSGIAWSEFPPLTGIYGVSASAGWAPLMVRRDRMGAGRPVLVGGERKGRRWAVAAATGFWRWALRDGASRQGYRALFTSVAGWLLQSPVGPSIELEETRPEPGVPLRWRVAPGVRDLHLAVTDSAGNLTWETEIAAPDSVVVGPALASGTFHIRASGRGAVGAVGGDRPIEVAATSEFKPRPWVPPLRLAANGGRSAAASTRERPVWPFALAVALLCVEWVWRRRLGLR